MEKGHQFISHGTFIETAKKQTGNYENLEKTKTEFLALLRKKFKPRGKQEAQYFLSDIFFLNYIKKTNLQDIIEDEKELNYGNSEIEKWVKNKRNTQLYVEGYKEKLLGEFFNYSWDGGIIKPTYGPTWGHIQAGLWFLNQLIKECPEKKQEILESIDIRNSRKSILKLAEMKIGKGLKLIEKAGESYAALIAFLGGEGAFKIGNRAGLIHPADIDSCVTDQEKQNLLDSYIKSDERIEPIKPSETTTEFKDGEYDIYMAINHGNIEADEHLKEEAKKLLKSSKKQNYLTLFQEAGVHPYRNKKYQKNSQI